jgi:hypothetical protein
LSLIPLRPGFGWRAGSGLQTIIGKGNDMTNIQPPLIGGKAIEDWDRLWADVDGGLKDYQPKLRRQVGLYRVTCKGQVMAVGMGTDRDGGLAKRLSDFRRPSPSGRNHHAGELINENLNLLEVEVLITGAGSDSHARKIGRQLKRPMIRMHQPVWSASN